MKLLTAVLLLTLMSIDPRDIGKINTEKAEAKKAYLAGDYKTAAEKYRHLVDTYGVAEDEVMLNMANAYYHLDDTTSAFSAYQPLTVSKNKKLRSLAHQQMGVMQNKHGKSEDALGNFKQALKADPTNDDARFNYEVVKKKVDKEKKEQQQKEQNQDKNKDQQDKDKQDKKDKENQEKKDEEKKDDKSDKEKKDKEDQKKKEKEDAEKKQQKDADEQKSEEDKKKDQLPPSVKDKLKDMELSEEKAKMILEAMKNREIQYLQQNRRAAQKPRDRSKPDW